MFGKACGGITARQRRIGDSRPTAEAVFAAQDKRRTSHRGKATAWVGSIEKLWGCRLHKPQLAGLRVSRLASTKLSTIAMSRNKAPTLHAMGVE